MADFYDILAGMIAANNGADASVVSAEEAAAEMYLNDLARAREAAASMGLDPDAAVAGYASIATPYAAGAPLFMARPPASVQPRGVQLTPAAIATALRRARANPASMLSAVPPAVALRLPQPAVRPSDPGPVDVSFMPFDSGANIAAGAQATISVSAQTVFKPERLNVPRNIADFFTIDNMTVGNVPLSAATGSVPAASFASDATGANVRKVTANPGVAVTLVVTNIDGAPHRFRATFFGWSSQPEGCRS